MARVRGRGGARKARGSVPVWDDPADQAWADRVRLGLVWHHHVPADVWEPALVEAHEAHLASGRSAPALFGDPDAHAARIADERFPLERRAAVDAEGTSPRDRWRLLPLAVGWTGTVTSTIFLAIEGWWVDVGPSGLVAAAGVGGAAVAAALGIAARRSGELRQGWLWWALAAALVVVAGTAAPALDGRPVLVAVPLVVALLLSVALLALGLRLVGRASSPAREPREETPEQWFARLGGVLRGRHLLPRAEVRRRVDETRESWRTGGRDHPAVDFGPPELHALRQVDGSPLPDLGRQRVQAWLATALAVFAAWLVVERAADGELERDLLWLAPVTAVLIWGAASQWRKLRTAAAGERTPGETPD